jgi:branched-chain amino acid aminotransferase
MKYAATVYEGIRAYWSDDRNELFIFRLGEHLERLQQSARLSRFALLETPAEIEAQLLGLIRANELREDLHVRILAYVTADDGLIDAVGPIELAIATMPMGRYPERGNAKTALDVGISHWQRLHDGAMPPRVKTSGNYVNSRLALTHARLSGYDDALLLDANGKVSEGPGYNFFMIRGGRVITPRVTQGILEGVTRATLIELFRAEHGIDVVEREIDKTEVMVADEAFFCGSGKEVRAIGSVDRHELSESAPGPVTRAIETTYFDVLRGLQPVYAHWLTPVWSS